MVQELVKEMVVHNPSTVGLLNTHTYTPNIMSDVPGKSGPSHVKPLLNEAVCEEISHEDGADAFFTAIINGGSEQKRKITDLKITIDGSSWSDREDDSWCMALRAFQPLSNNLEHLQIVIKGPVLFTQFDYIRPAMFTMIPFGYPPDDEDSAYETSDPLHSSGTKTPPKNAKRAQEIRSPSCTWPVVRYSKRAIPPEKVKLHISEKGVVSALLNLHKPIPRITIQGHMELGLRRHLIAALNPDWITSPHCYAQAGYRLVDSDAVEEMERREKKVLSAGLEMIKIGPQGSFTQDGEDFGLTKDQSCVGRTSGMTVPTGKAGRHVFGWKAISVRAWKGPTDRHTTYPRD